MQKWKKLGLVFCPNGEEEWMSSHASVPFVDYLGDDFYKIYFSSRNKDNESSIGYVVVNILEPQSILEVSQKPVLSKGALGTFDDSGTMGCCVINKSKNKKYLYYIGWNLGVTVPFRNAIGLAISDDDGVSFTKKFEGPILDRSSNEPYFTASNCVIYDEGMYKIWYLSCTEWKQSGSEIIHNYHIKYAESDDGVNWNRKGIVAIDYIDEHEYAISVPRVIKDGKLYKMWFSSRATKNIPTYRIRYAESQDGVNWVRKDDEVGIDVSDSGWDSEMICYPYVFDHKGKRYMLYNGNGYGKTGFGLAVLEQ